MSTQANSPEPPSNYFTDAESAAEMARLVRQASMLRHSFGLLPSSLEQTERWQVLDIGCGPGEWAIEMAQQYPSCQVFGIDISVPMITYASSFAESRKLSNVQFRVMDAHQPLDFPDAFFDLVNARFIVSSMSTATWPLLLHECFRLLRPAGVLIETEPEGLGTTTSPALTQYNLLLAQAMRQAGQCFTPSGESYGLAAVQPRLFQEAGFEQIRQEAFIINFSAGMPAYQATCENLQILMKHLQSLLVRNGLITQEDVDMLYARTLSEMESEDFCAAAFFQRVWGKKPG